MEFLTFQENTQLQKILINNKLLQIPNAEYRIALLKNCGLDKLCSGIEFDKPSFQFVTVLYSKLSEIKVQYGDSERLAIIVFLEFLTQIDDEISDKEKVFIEVIINKWEEHNKSPSVQKQNTNQIKELLSQGRHKPSPISTVTTSVQVDRNIIIDFDLKTLTKKFRENIGYTGAFTFSIGGDVLLLEKYIIERIKRELKNFTRLENQQIEIQLYKNNIVKHDDIEDRLNQKYKSLENIFNYKVNTNVILIVWNYDIPSENMKLWAKRSWAGMHKRILQLIENQSRCFILIWVNVNKNPLGGFTSLPMEKFKADDLDPWFRNQLQKIGVTEEQINGYLYRLKNQDGNLVGTYREMNHMIQELQGGNQHYG